MVGKHSATLYISSLLSVGGLMTSTVVKHEKLLARGPFTVKQKPLLPSSLVMDKEKRMRTGKFRSEINAHNTACTRLVGVAAFSGNFHGLRLVPSKRRYLVPPTSG